MSTAPAPAPQEEDVRARPDVSIVLPTYNEVGHVREEVARIRAAMDASDYTWEIVAVDDGSTDGTREWLRAAVDEEPRLRLIEHRRNLGSGGARRTGTRAARGHVVVWTDVDMTYPNDDIPHLVKSLEVEGYDQVVGARTSEEGSHKALRVPAKWAIRRLAQYLAQEEIPDLNSGFRAFRRDKAVRYLNRLPNGFSCVTTMTMSFLADGLAVGYVDIPYAAREGESKFHWYRDTRKYLLQVVRMILGYEPLRVFMPVGLSLLLFGVAKLVYDITTKDLRLATNTLLILFAAFQVISIGLLADLVVRVTKPPVDDPLARPTR
ncbi:glycosyltransferase family 2 protein [Egicoccus halophilus]|uniref:Dolichol-phosphate mannosyltransferase n=1 Tax=Egicoccus halophilus TaxID=1670830 RepID=A0A8J3ERX7_9ACTN|nr:glycosyltransferase family 2 protein [Egicoccus halophilus]GGI05949.1 dolichol-phosphate mannosyltransferase [Egicoccus halophilus]